MMALPKISGGCHVWRHVIHCWKAGSFPQYIIIPNNTALSCFQSPGTYDLANRTMKFVQEQYIASAEYDLQLEFTPDTEDTDGTCKSSCSDREYWSCPLFLSLIIMREENALKRDEKSPTAYR